MLLDEVKKQEIDPKKPWQSKTMWASAIAAVLPLVAPPAAAWVAMNPELYSMILGAIFGGLRMASQDKVVIK